MSQSPAVPFRSSAWVRDQSTARRSSGNLKKNLGKLVEICGNMGKMRFQTNGVTVKPTKSWINKT
jgi:hypothetical protein